MSGGPPGRPLALRLSVTDRCQLRCVYCRPGPGDPAPSARRRLGARELSRFVAIAQRRFGVAKVRLTGGEPLLREDVVELVHALSALEVPDLALTTNGQRLGELAASLRQAGLRRVNVSLDSLRDDTYREVARAGGPSRTLAGIDAALRAGLSPLKLNAVLLRGVNEDEADDLLAFALERGCELRFIELMPTGLQPAEFARRHVPSAELLAHLARTLEIEPLAHEPACSSRRYRVRDRRGRVGVFGVISPMTRPFCGACRRLRLTSDGRLIGCLGRRETLRIARALRTPGPCAEATVAAAMEQALLRKRTTASFDPAPRMSWIGG